VLRYTVRRLLLIPIVLLGMTLVTFVASQVVPTDPVAAFLGARYEAGTNDEAIAAVKAKWGWDKPIWDRYVIYLSNLARGDLGTSSSSRRPVIDDLVEYTPATIELVIATMLVALLVAVPIGVLTAAKRGGLTDNGFKILSVVVITTPVFWLGLLALNLFYRDLRIAAGPGQLDLFIKAPPRVTGMVVVDSVLAGRPDALLNALHHLALPAGLLGTVVGVYFARIIRSEMADALDSDYVRTAQGKGLRPGVVLYRHALRNALVPVITLSGLAFGSLLTSTIVIENVFGWSGLGSYAYRAATKIDLPGIAGVTLVIGTIYLLINLGVDLLYALADPRVRIR
jgi:peptide/nickel transport system permease protein